MKLNDDEKKVLKVMHALHKESKTIPLEQLEKLTLMSKEKIIDVISKLEKEKLVDSNFIFDKTNMNSVTNRFLLSLFKEMKNESEKYSRYSSLSAFIEMLDGCTEKEISIVAETVFLSYILLKGNNESSVIGNCFEKMYEKIHEMECSFILYKMVENNDIEIKEEDGEYKFEARKKRNV